jgi:hypothetical protein
LSIVPLVGRTKAPFDSDDRFIFELRHCS